MLVKSIKDFRYCLYSMLRLCFLDICIMLFTVTFRTVYGIHADILKIEIYIELFCLAMDRSGAGLAIDATARGLGGGSSPSQAKQVRQIEDEAARSDSPPPRQ